MAERFRILDSLRGLFRRMTVSQGVPGCCRVWSRGRESNVLRKVVLARLPVAEALSIEETQPIVGKRLSWGESHDALEVPLRGLDVAKGVVDVRHDEVKRPIVGMLTQIRLGMPERGLVAIRCNANTDEPGDYLGGVVAPSLRCVEILLRAKHIVSHGVGDPFIKQLLCGNRDHRLLEVGLGGPCLSVTTRDQQQRDKGRR